jgi:hypothetical protein
MEKIVQMNRDFANRNSCGGWGLRIYMYTEADYSNGFYFKIYMGPIRSKPINRLMIFCDIKGIVDQVGYWSDKYSDDICVYFMTS